MKKATFAKRCEVKGCGNPTTILIQSHELGCKEICQDCLDKYFTNGRPESMFAKFIKYIKFKIRRRRALKKIKKIRKDKMKSLFYYFEHF